MERAEPEYGVDLGGPWPGKRTLTENLATRIAAPLGNDAHPTGTDGGSPAGSGTPPVARPAAAPPGNPATRAERAAAVNVIAAPEDFPERNDLDERQIAALTTRDTNGFSWGLTTMRPNARGSLVPQHRAGSGGGVDTFYNTIPVTLRYEDRAVYVTRNAPPGGRRYQLIRDHEQLHVDLGQRYLVEHVAFMRQALVDANLPTTTNAIHAHDAATGERLAAAAIGAAVQPALHALTERLERAHSTLDHSGPTMRTLTQLAEMDPELRAEHHGAGGIGYAGVSGGELFLNGISPNDVVQGQLEDCYFAAALASVAATRPGIIQSMFQHVGGNDYDVRFFVWEGTPPVRRERHVVVDTYFPVYARTRGFAYMRPGETAGPGRPELWPLLAEKAYARLRGGYDDIGDHGGFAARAMEAITGSPAETVGPAGDREGSPWTRLFGATQSRSPCTLNTKQAEDPRFAAVGMYHDHSYIVLAAEVAGGAQRVQLRNPWGVRYRRGEVPPGGDDNATFWVSFRDVEPLIGSISVG